MSWTKKEDKYDGPWSWTEYTDHDGNVYKIYDMMTMPATPNAYILTPSTRWKHIANEINKIVNNE